MAEWGQLHYHIERVDREIIAVVDDFDRTNPGMTLTNGVETLLDELHRNGELLWSVVTSSGDVMPLRERRVIYRDTDGFWDEIVWRSADGPEFLGFSPIHVRNVDVAIGLARTLGRQYGRAGGAPTRGDLDPAKLTSKAFDIHNALESEGYSQIEIAAILGAGMAFSLGAIPIKQRRASFLAHLEAMEGIGLLKINKRTGRATLR